MLKIGRDVVIAALLGAEEFGFATAALIVEGCVMMRACQKNTCPQGIATQDPELRARFKGKPEYVVNFFMFIAEEVREILAQLGFRTLEEAIGHVECLDQDEAIKRWKSGGIDLSNVLKQAGPVPGTILHQTIEQNHELEKALDNKLIELAQPALEHKEPVRIEMPIRNVNRTGGTMVGYEITRRYGEEGLPDDTIDMTLHGSGGQSIGAFIPRGETMRIYGEVLKEMIFAVAKQDSPALAEGLLRFAGTEADPEDYPALLADLDVIVKEFGTVDLAELDIAAFLTALTQMAGRHNIEVPSTVTTVGRALVTLEGLLDEFIPDVNMIEIISDHIATSKSLKNATKDEIKSLGVEGHQALHATLGTMTELKTVARMLTRGQLRVNMELVGSEEPFQLLSDMVNRLTMALIVVGLFVGSSIVYYAGMKPIIFGIPVIGFMGYVVAFALGVWIVIDIYLKGRKTKKR